MVQNLELLTHQPQSNPHPTPILFIHGAWHGAWCWAEHFLPYFAERGYTAHALSLRGHGASAGRERLRWSSIADYASDVAQVASQLPKPPILIGHSMGGLIVQKYLEKHPATAAVLLASVPAGGIIKTVLRIAARHPPKSKRPRGAYNTRTEIFPNVAHDMMLEAGWQSVADHILDWLHAQNL